MRDTRNHSSVFAGFADGFSSSEEEESDKMDRDIDTSSFEAENSPLSSSQRPSKSSSGRKNNSGKGKKKKKKKKKKENDAYGRKNGLISDWKQNEEGEVSIRKPIVTIKSILKHNDDLGDEEIKSSKSVGFKNIFVREYVRAISYDAVPTDGSWPLGLSDQVTSELCGDINSFEKRRASELRDRYAHAIAIKNRKGKKKVKAGARCDEVDVSTKDTVFETRQFDYKRGHRNPLLKPMSEINRHTILLDTLDPDHKHHIDKKAQKSCRSVRRRTRGLSQAEMDEMLESSNGTTVQMDLEHEAQLLRNELDGIREFRSNVGCSCQKLKVTNKISDRKLKEELRKRRLETDGSKVDLVERLKAAVDSEPCCSESSCPCVKEGINCQADLCSCWCGKKGNIDRNAILRCQELCGNRHGIYIYDSNRISENRASVLCTIATRD